MANLANLLATIAANVYTNHNNEVTAQMVKDALGAIVSTMGQGGYIYKGLATTSTNPSSPDANVFYIATGAGTYTNFGGIVVNAGEVAILKGTGTSWSKDVTGAATAAKLTELEQDVTRFPIPITETKRYIPTNAGVGNSIGSSTYSNDYAYMRFPVNPGDAVIVNGAGGSTPRLWAFIDEDEIILSAADANITKSDLWLVAPEDTAEIIINTRDTSVPSYYVSQDSPFLEIHEEAGKLQEEVDEIGGGLEKLTYDNRTILACDEKLKAENLTTGKYRYSADGTIQNSLGTFYSNPIWVRKGDVFYADAASSASAQSAIAMLSIVTESNVWHETLLHPSSAGAYSYAFQEDCFVCISGATSNADTFHIVHIGAAEEIEDISEGVFGRWEELTLDGATDGYYQAQNGNEVSQAYCFISKNIQVKAGDSIKFLGAVTSFSATSIVSETDSNGNFLKCIVPYPSSNGQVYTFQKDGYIKISAAKANILLIIIHRGGLIEKVSNNDESIKSIEDFVGPVNSDIGLNVCTTGYYRVTNGTISPLSNFFYSNPIPVHKGDVFYANDISSGTAQSAIAILSSVDSNNNFLSLLMRETSAGSYSYTFTEDGFASVSGAIGDLRCFSFKRIGVNQRMEDIKSLIPALSDPANRLPKLSPNPVHNLSFNCGLFAIFKTVGVIGDSLASGEMQGYHNDGTMYYSDMYELSWGQQLAKMTGVDVYNFSSGGQYAKAWMNGNTARTWDANDAANGAHSNPKQCYFIGLAHNDKTAVENNTYTAGIGTTADINDLDYTQNADSYVGWYARIIQAIKSIEPRAYIFCITPPNSTYDSYSEQIRNIVTYFAGQRVYLIDLRQYGMAQAGDWRSLNTHMSAAGYLYYAYEIANYVDWIIRNNGADFKYTSLVGTDILDTNPNP